MDLCEGGELFDKISAQGHFSEHAAANLFKEMMSAVNYCTIKKLCHKDLKPENFMFVNKETNSHIKLIDFGLSELFESSSIFYSSYLGNGKVRMKDRVGTVNFYLNHS